MNESLFHNKVTFYHKEEEKSYLGIWISVILSVFFLVSCSLNVRCSIPLNAIYNEENNSLVISWPLEKIEQLSNFEKIKVQEEQYSFHIQNMSEIYVNEDTIESFQNIEISSPEKYRKNEVIKIYLLDKEEKIIFKFKKIIINGGVL